jgi:hypothetical protein
MIGGQPVSQWVRDVAIAAAALGAGYLFFSPAKAPPLAHVRQSGRIISTTPAEQEKPSIRKDMRHGIEQAAAIAAILVTESRSAYYATGRPCACPDDFMRNGRKCGGNSAYSRPGGATPYCYVSDVPAAVIQKHQERLLRH